MIFPGVKHAILFLSGLILIFTTVVFTMSHSPEKSLRQYQKPLTSEKKFALARKNVQCEQAFRLKSKDNISTCKFQCYFVFKQINKIIIISTFSYFIFVPQ